MSLSDDFYEENSASENESDFSYNTSSEDESARDNEATKPKEHRKKHNCPEPSCGAVLHRPIHLKNHILVCHSGVKPFKCHKCDERFSNQSGLNRHNATAHHKDRKLMCEVEGCGRFFSQKFSLKRHILSMHKNEKFYQENVLNAHQAEAHCQLEPDNSPKQDSTSQKEHKCPEPECGASFNRPYQLGNHILVHHRGLELFKCLMEGCGKSYSNEVDLNQHNVVAHLNENHYHKMQVTCEIQGCGMTFANNYSLKRHVMRKHNNKSCHPKTELHQSNDTHAKKAMHTCPDCGASFNRPYRLKNHILSRHSGIKPFKCLIEGCGKSYSNPSHLQRHNTIAHLGEEDYNNTPIMCDVEGCGMSFLNKFNLKRHVLRKHKKVNFQCDICKEVFLKKSLLNAHKTEFHNAPAQYKCSKCPQEFIQFHLFQKHSKRHKSYVCDCEKAFEKWTELRAHRTKCSQKSSEHICAICDKSFNLKQNLTQHMLKIHVAESQAENFKCPYDECTKSYKYEKNLNFHVKSYHLKIAKEIECVHEGCHVVLKSNKNLKQHLKICHDEKAAGKSLKKPRKPRKDKGIPKISMVERLSGVKLSYAEHQKLLNGPLNKDMKISGENELGSEDISENVKDDNRANMNDNNIDDLQDNNMHELNKDLEIIGKNEDIEKDAEANMELDMGPLNKNLEANDKNEVTTELRIQDTSENNSGLIKNVQVLPIIELNKDVAENVDIDLDIANMEVIVM